MTCHSAGDAMLDLARGVAIPSSALRALEEHLDRCPACTRDLQRQRELTAGLQALAAQAREWTAPARLEAALLGRVAAGAGQSANAPRRSLAWYAAPAAALIVCAIWIGMRRTANTPTVAPAIPRAAFATPSGVPDATRVDSTSPRTEGALPPQGRRSTGRAVNAPARREVRRVEFSVLPAAAGSPAFESGTIVRIEVPVATLPEYGLKIPPDVARSNVEADLLVGQDGQARAIRLVADPDSSRSRQ